MGQQQYRFSPSSFAWLRHVHDLRLADIADAADLAISQVWKYEHGQTEPRINALCRMAHALGVKPMALLEEVDQ